jgi:hypothetical protein
MYNRKGMCTTVLSTLTDRMEKEKVCWETTQVQKNAMALGRMATAD